MENQARGCSELVRFIFIRIKEPNNLRLSYKLRLLNKSCKMHAEKRIDSAKIYIVNIEKLANSNLNDRIQFLDVVVRSRYEQLDELRFLSPTYFPNIKNITVMIDTIRTRIKDRATLLLQEPLILQNVTFIDKSRFEALKIVGKYEVEIRNCKFDGWALQCYGNGAVSLQNCQFINSGMCGFACTKCDVLNADKIFVKNVEHSIKSFAHCGLIVADCKGGANIKNIQVYSCKGCGILLGERQLNFNLQNVFVQNCFNSGIQVGELSYGKIVSADVQGCRDFGIYISPNSRVRYSQIQFSSNKKGDVYVHTGSYFLPIN